MRSSDWSSDVCSSDLADVRDPHYRAAVLAAYGRTVAGRRPSAPFVQRRIAGGGMRTFHRLLIPLVTPGGVPERLSETLPLVTDTETDLLPELSRITDRNRLVKGEGVSGGVELGGSGAIKKK